MKTTITFELARKAALNVVEAALRSKLHFATCRKSCTCLSTSLAILLQIHWKPCFHFTAFTLHWAHSATSRQLFRCTPHSGSFTCESQL